MMTALQQIVEMHYAQVNHGLDARHRGDIHAARRYFARAEAYAFAAGTLARELGDRETVITMDRAESQNFRRATSEDGGAYA
jgi:hypothetical protein